MPLKLYLYNEGFVRLCSEKYDYNHLNNSFSFITNIALNMRNKKHYKYPQNLTKIEDGNLWNLDTYQNYCEKNGLNYTKIYEIVKDIFIKMVFTIRKKTIEDINYNKLHMENSSSNFYHLIGFDIILDENLKPYLLEANRQCSFRDNNDAEKYYIYNIMADTLNLVGLRIINKQNNTIYNDISNDYFYTEIIEDSLCELERPRGGYNLIFPLKSNIEKYKKYYLDDIPKEDEELWKRLKE